MHDSHLHRINETTRRLGRVFLFEDEADLQVWKQRHEPQTAHELQTRVLPTRPPTVPGYNFNFWSQPAAEVGGDYLNFCACGGNKIGIVTADVSGKGIGAALVVSLLRATFRTQSWGNHNPCDVLTRANDFLSHSLPLGTFVTCAYGVLDIGARHFAYARAGHEPLLLARNGQIEEIAPMGLPLGISDSREFRALLEVRHLDLETDDRLLLFTDGLTEAMNSQRDEFGMKRIIETIQNTSNDPLPALRETLRVFRDGAPPHDDTTIVSLVVEP